MATIHPGAWGLVGGVAGAGAVVLLQQAFFAPPALATVDMAALVAAEARRAELAGLERAQVEAAATQAAARIRRVLDEVAAERRLAIAPKGAVAAGAPDVTALVARRLGLELPRRAPAPAAAPAPERRPSP